MTNNNEDEQGMARMECRVIPFRPRSASAAALDRAVQARIGEQLRAMYDSLVEEPVPDRIVALLGRLDRTGEGGGHER